MHWIASTETNADNAALGKCLWDAADKFRANSGLKSQECSAPAFGLEGDIRHSGNVNSYDDDPHDATGAAYPAVTVATFEKPDLLSPPGPLLKQFGDATTPMAEQMHALQRQIQDLRRTRNLLLPRLRTPDP